MEIYQKLVEIQSSLKAPKSQTNAFGKYKYRSCEDILEAVKPLLKEQGLVLTISDDIVEVGGRVYVKATATVTDGNGHIDVTAFAREAFDKKGMDDAQITGSASSYARKYALNGLFCIDDTKDSDATNDHKPKEAPKVEKTLAEIPTVTIIMEYLTSAKTDEQLKVMFDRAMEREWSVEDKKTLTECRNNVSAKITRDLIDSKKA